MPTAHPTTPNGKTVAGIYADFSRGAVTRVMDQIDPEVEWIETESTSLPLHGTFTGLPEVLEHVLTSIGEQFSQFRVQAERWIESGDDVVVTGRVIARTWSGRDLDAPYANVFSFRDGKVIRTDVFHDTALWLAALAAPRRANA